MSSRNLDMTHLLSHYHYSAPKESIRFILSAIKDVVSYDIRPRGYKTFYMLNLAEHEIKNAHKYRNSQNQWKFQIKVTKASYLSCL